MANGHKPDRPPLQGDFGPVFTSKPKTSTNTQGPAPASVTKRGVAPKGVGGSRSGSAGRGPSAPKGVSGDRTK